MAKRQKHRMAAVFLRDPLSSHHRQLETAGCTSLSSSAEHVLGEYNYTDGEESSEIDKPYPSMAVSFPGEGKEGGHDDRESSERVGEAQEVQDLHASVQSFSEKVGVVLA